MTELKPARILVYPMPILRQRCKAIDVDAIDVAFRRRLERLSLTLRRLYDRAVGIAAPQIGWGVRVFVLRPDLLGGNQGAAPVVFVNPRIVDREGEQEGNEGCLSFPPTGVWQVPVKCSQRVTIEAVNSIGDPIRHSAGDFAARAIQHEIEHLAGRCLVDRTTAKDAKRLRAVFQGKGRGR